jgi:hypothetical protein
MKIESHNITYTVAHEFSYEKRDNFQERLTTTNFDTSLENNEFGAIDEIDLLARIKFILIQVFLKELSSKQDESSVQFEELSQENSLHVKKKTPTLSTSIYKEIEYESSYKESESLSMQTKGSIQTADGKSIDIDLNFTMARSFYSKTTIQETVFIDPLVINFEGDLPSFTETTFCFDIDCDGESDQISSLAKGNGFLAVDKNENGTIDNGSELFGPSSGNGFKELSSYDSDGNSWIDENDPIFEGLRIWSDDKLIGLGEVGLGAIYLGACATPYTYKNDINESLAKLQQSSIFLFESGKIGTISQIDFAQQEPLVNILSKV